ncbi:hypothetical protein [Advenella sp. EE-W14]|uniref:hypothetical protein n=1 Tax=Advenella sp. EE-W14 TaxID=2722705 RepID=UPI00145DCC3A|nr:hypothetical protein [Advenella sp. EE-W14]
MSLKTYEQILSTIDPRVSKAAKLRALYPVIEQNIHAGARLGMIVDDLEQLGISMSYAVFQNALSRIRKNNKTSEPKNSNSPIPAPPPVTAIPSPVPAPAVTAPPKRIENPIDLRAIRDMAIDLNALREEGLANRRQKKNDEH